MHSARGLPTHLKHLHAVELDGPPVAYVESSSSPAFGTCTAATGVHGCPGQATALRCCASWLVVYSLLPAWAPYSLAQLPSDAAHLRRAWVMASKLSSVCASRFTNTSNDR